MHYWVFDIQHWIVHGCQQEVMCYMCKVWACSQAMQALCRSTLSGIHTDGDWSDPSSYIWVDCDYQEMSIILNSLHHYLRPWTLEELVTAWSLYSYLDYIRGAWGGVPGFNLGGPNFGSRATKILSLFIFIMFIFRMLLLRFILYLSLPFWILYQIP